MVQILGLVEDKKCFNTFNFMKTKLKNELGGNLNNVVHMYSPRFYIKETFPFPKKSQIGESPSQALQIFL